MNTKYETVELAGGALTEEQRAEWLDLVERLMLAGRHPDWAIAIEAATALRSLLVAHTGQPLVDKAAGRREELAADTLEFVGKVLDAKEKTLSHGCKQAPFAEMFAEFVAMRAPVAQANWAQRAEWIDRNVTGNPVLMQAMKNIAGGRDAGQPVAGESRVRGDELSGTTGHFYVYDPNAGHVDFYDSDAARDEAHKEALAE